MGHSAEDSSRPPFFGAIAPARGRIGGRDSKGQGRMRQFVFAAAGAALLAGPAQANWVGQASYYNLKGATASGERVGHMTAAHRTLPFGTRLKVTNLRNNRSVVVTVNDRGPFIRHRIVDVSAGAAHALGFRAAGVARVRVERAH